MKKLPVLLAFLAACGCGKSDAEVGTEFRLKLKALGWENVAYDTGLQTCRGEKDGFALFLGFGGNNVRVYTVSGQPRGGLGDYSIKNRKFYGSGGYVSDRDEKTIERLAVELWDAYQAAKK